MADYDQQRELLNSTPPPARLSSSTELIDLEDIAPAFAQRGLADSIQENLSMDVADSTNDNTDDAMDECERQVGVIRVREPFRNMIMRQPADNPLERLLRRGLEQNSMALVVYQDPKKNLTLGPLLTLLDDQRRASLQSEASSNSHDDVEMTDAIEDSDMDVDSGSMEL